MSVWAKISLLFCILINCKPAKSQQVSLANVQSKPGGLNLSQRGLDWDSQSRHWQRVSLDGQENLDNFKKLVLTIEKSWSRLRNLDFVSTPPSSFKSLDQDQEICWDMKFLANLDSLSRSRSRVSQYYHISWSRFLNLSRFLAWSTSKMSRYLDKSQKVSIYLESLNENFNTALPQLKSLNFKNLNREKIYLVSTWWIISTLKKSWSRRTISISILIGLNCRDPQA